jgi:hypothetical protein
MPRKSGRSQGISRLAVALALLVTLLPATAVMAGPEGCLPFPAPSGTTVNVSTVAELQAAIANLQSNTTVLIADGTYQLTNTLNIRSVANAAIRGASGNANAVILSGKGMSNPDYGNVPHVMAVFDATDVTVADLTLRDAYFHGIQIHGEDDADRVRLVRTRVLDNGEQQVKVSTAGSPGPYADDGVVECSVIGYTDRARSAYTNGVDVLAGSGWIIRDNTFQNIRAPSGQLAGPAVLMWRNSIGTIVERNRFIENDRAIAFGLSAPDANSRDGETTYDHQGGVIRNNMIYRVGPGDVGITVNYAKDVSIVHNTVILNGTFAQGAIEYRFSSTNADIRFNLTDAPIWQRDGASATVAGNVASASPAWFVAPASGDLHLLPSATPAIDQAGTGGSPDDYDRESRIGSPADIGADELGATSGPFFDVSASHQFAADISWLKEQGITNGCNVASTLFCPELTVTRGQMARFLRLALGLPAGTEDQFSDDQGSIFEADINAIAVAGITTGCDAGRFCPDQGVTRAQMASFLRRALALTPIPTGPFVDVGGIHESDINAIAAAGITQGCGASIYCPDGLVTRGQMAAFLHRSLG